MAAEESQGSASDRQHEFTELLLECRSRLYGYLFALVRNASDADDLFQAAAAVLWEKYDAFEKGTDFTAWAIRTGSLVYRNFARTRRRSRVFFSEEAVNNIARAASMSSDRGSTVRMDALRSCLGKLSDADRQLVEMCYTDDRKIKEIATQEGRTDQSVYSAIARIRRALASCIEREISV